jgi:hypothetical protein
MKHILSYNESFSSEDKLNLLLKKFGKSIDTKELLELLEPYKGKLRKLSAKYTINGKIDASLIEKDIRKLNLSTNEALSENVILRLLVRVINLPINLVRILFHFFKNMWDEGNFIKLVQTFVVAIIVFILSFSVYQIGEHVVNGISVGIVDTEVKLTPAHYETKTHTYTDGNGKLRTYTTQEYVPDTWEMDVRASNGRIETWETTDKVSGVGTNKESVVRKTEEWHWIGTKEYGEKMGGNFSGGGSGGDYK